jgi:hypothetical protein
MKQFISTCFLIALVACSAKIDNPSTPVAEGQNPVKDGGLLSKKPCGPPCFYGIVPGITTDTDAANTMEKTSDIFSSCKAFDFTRTGGNRGANCTYANVGYKNSAVDMVSFAPSSKVSVQQVIDLYGPPDSVSVRIVSLPDSPDRTSMALYFDAIQTMIGLGEQEGARFTVQPSTEVTLAIYLSTSSYAETRNLPNNQGWQGYDVYLGIR